MHMKRLLAYFSKFEWTLWSVSIFAISFSFFFGNASVHPLSVIASLLGVTALIFIAKGNVIGQFLIILFSLLYGIVSISFRYWGEMITYVFMSAPAAALACVTWLKNPSKKGKSEVQISSMTVKKWILTLLANFVITLLFYFLLKAFNTKNLLLSTVSVSTSFFAATLLMLRSPFYALAYAANDIVLIGLWTLACLENVQYLPMVICFIAFLCNDLYGFYNWNKMKRRQECE